jgi:putative glutamine amidotransferase
MAVEESGGKCMKMIGIPMSTSKTQYYINQAYADYVSEAGMIPVLIAPQEELGIFIEVCDGLLLPGGIDIEPTYYGEDNIASYHVDPEKDEFERQLFYRFVEAGKPIFGICRGMQLIVREYILQHEKADSWLTYFQNIGDHSLAERLDIPRTVPSHSVEIRCDLYGGSKKKTKIIFTNSMHHQALLIGKKRSQTSKLEILGTTTTGLSNKEVERGMEVVEAIKIQDGKANILAVQWHPEELRDYELIQKFFGVEVEEEAAE